jgi:hypothetical protein
VITSNPPGVNEQVLDNPFAERSVVNHGVFRIRKGLEASVNQLVIPGRSAPFAELLHAEVEDDETAEKNRVGDQHQIRFEDEKKRRT